jgi:PHP family Zn ribbon phosphoesterase
MTDRWETPAERTLRLMRELNKDALDADGLVKPGMTLHTPLYLKDQLNTVSRSTTMHINDAMQQLPAEFRSKIALAKGWLADAATVENGVATLQSVIGRMNILAGNGGGGGFGQITDSNKSALGTVRDHLQGLIASARTSSGR